MVNPPLLISTQEFPGFFSFPRVFLFSCPRPFFYKYPPHRMFRSIFPKMLPKRGPRAIRKRDPSLPRHYRSKRRLEWPKPANPSPTSLFMRFVMVILLALPIALQSSLSIFFQSYVPAWLSLFMYITYVHTQQQKTAIDQALMLRGAILALCAVENGEQPHIPWQTLAKVFHVVYPNHPYVHPCPKMVYSQRSAVLQGSGNALAPDQRITYAEAGNHLPPKLRSPFTLPFFTLPLFTKKNKTKKGPITSKYPKIIF